MLSALEAYNEARKPRRPSLRGRIKVRLLEDAMGNVTLTPVAARVAAAIKSDNVYNGACDVFIQEARIDDWKDTLPRRAFYGRGKARAFNDGAVFLMDEGSFRTMVGGGAE